MLQKYHQNSKTIGHSLVLATAQQGSHRTSFKIEEAIEQVKNHTQTQHG